MCSVRASRAWRRAAVVVGAIAAVVALAAAPPAVAHGGAVLVDRDAGPYTVAVQAAPLGRDPLAVDYTVTLRRDGRPEEDAHVRLRVRGARGAWSRPYPARRAANTYEVVLSQPRRDAWRGWDVRVELDGAGGRAALTYRAAAGEADRGGSGGPPPSAAVGSLAGVALLAGAAVLATRRRRARGARGGCRPAAGPGAADRRPRRAAAPAGPYWGGHRRRKGPRR